MYRSGPHGVLARAVAALAVAGIVVTGPDDRGGSTTPVVLATALAAVVWAVVVRSRDRANHYRLARARAVADAARTERLRLAENLHDLVSHRLAGITLHASTEPLLDEAGTRRALRDIESSARAATADMRQLLATLRSADEASLSPSSCCASDPQGWRDEVLSWRQAGLNVQVSESATPIYGANVKRILTSVVREALANVARHAGHVRVRVQVSREDDNLQVTVYNDVPEPGRHSSVGGGTGLATLARRCHELGGTLVTTEVGNGFLVEAIIPDPGGSRP
ncbi:histidine kinase [Actinomyces qiguomingii]|uniref:sensor histidine kinase n=1 Tax=Actinomyces qiguomingii TaxID=2057800 RepID=UPI000C9FFC18